MITLDTYVLFPLEVAPPAESVKEYFRIASLTAELPVPNISVECIKAKDRALIWDLMTLTKSMYDKHY
jgi:hypothetical protein